MTEEKKSRKRKFEEMDLGDDDITPTPPQKPRTGARFSIQDIPSSVHRHVLQDFLGGADLARLSLASKELGQETKQELEKRKEVIENKQVKNALEEMKEIEWFDEVRNEPRETAIYDWLNIVFSVPFENRYWNKFDLLAEKGKMAFTWAMFRHVNISTVDDWLAVLYYFLNVGQDFNLLPAVALMLRSKNLSEQDKQDLFRHIMLKPTFLLMLVKEPYGENQQVFRTEEWEKGVLKFDSYTIWRTFKPYFDFYPLEERRGYYKTLLDLLKQYSKEKWSEIGTKDESGAWTERKEMSYISDYTQTKLQNIIDNFVSADYFEDTVDDVQDVEMESGS